MARRPASQVFRRCVRAVTALVLVPISVVITGAAPDAGASPGSTPLEAPVVSSCAGMSQQVLNSGWSVSDCSAQSDPDGFPTGFVFAVSYPGDAANYAIQLLPGSSNDWDLQLGVCFPLHESSPAQTVVHVGYEISFYDGSTSGCSDVGLRVFAEPRASQVVQSFGAGLQPALSGDGQVVAWTSTNPTSQPDDRPDDQVDVSNAETGATSEVSVAPDGTPGDGQSYDPAISSDGRYVAFASWASNLVDDGGGDGIFERDLTTGETDRVSVDENGSPIYGDPVNGSTNGPTYYQTDGAVFDGPAMSADGRYVVFVLDNALCDARPDGMYYQLADGGGDAWVWDKQSGHSYRIPGDCLASPAISADGAVIAYDVADAEADGYHIHHVYAWDTINRTSLGAVSVDFEGNLIAGAKPSISGNGRYIAFEAGINPDGTFGTGANYGDTLNGSIAVRDRSASVTTVMPHHNDNPQSNYTTFPYYVPDPVMYPRISGDGRYVAYSTTAHLYCTGAIASSGQGGVHLGTELTTYGSCWAARSSTWVADMMLRRYAEIGAERDDGEPAISADGQYIAFVRSNGNYSFDVEVADRTRYPLNVPSTELQGNDPFCPVCHSAATRLDPINTATGAYERQDTDITLPGAGVPFTLARSYSSDTTSTGLFGKGWSANLTSSLEVLPSGDAQITAGTGAVVVFARQLDGSYVAPPEVRASLIALPNGGWQVETTNLMLTTYNGNGQMVSQVDRNNAGLAFSYDTQARLSTVTDASGRTVTFTYGATGAAVGMITTVETSGGRSWTYSYVASQADGTTPLLGSVTDPGGATMTYGYDAATDQLTSIVDGNGNTVASIGYGASGVDQLTEASNADGTAGSYSWQGTGDGGTATTTDANGGSWTDTYIGNNLMSSADPDGNTTSYTYDDRNDRTSITDADGGVTTYTYDDSGNVLSETDPLGNITSYTYDADNNTLSETDPMGHVTSYAYDTYGNRTSETDPTGGVTSWTYDSAGNELSQTDPDGDTTTYTYDVAGNQLTSTDPLGHTTTYTYDAAGNQLTSIDPLGHTTTYTYDSAGRVLGETDPLGRVTTYGYDAVGNKTSVTTASGTAQEATTSYTYDAANHLLTTTDPLGRVTANTYDNVGNLVSTTDPDGDVTSYGYDAENRRISTTRPNGNVDGVEPADYTTTYDYDSIGNQVSVTQPVGGGAQAQTRTDYNAARQVVDTVDANGNETVNGYDADGNLTQVTDPTGAITTYGYDALNRRISQTDPLGRTTTYGYDGEGHQTSVTDPAGGTTTDVYDGAGRKTAEVAPNGNVTGADPADFTTTYGYDADGDLTSTTDPLGHATSATYDADGERLSATDATGAATSYAYDAAGNLTTTTAPDGSTVTDGYDIAGQKISTADAAGHTTTYGYDGEGRVTSTTDPTGALTAATYDADGNQATSTSPNGGVTRNHYDSADRLIDSISPTGGDTSYSYDPAGNKTSVIDPDGNTTSYSYDADNRVVSTVQPDGTEVDNSYDAAGQLVSYTTPYNPAPGVTPAHTVPGPAAAPAPPAAPDAGGGGGSGGDSVTPAPAGLGNPYPTAVLADAPSVYYRLGDAAGSTTAADSSGNGNDGVVTNTVTFGGSGALANEADSAAAFGAGEVQESSGAGLPTGNADRSVEVWFTTTSTDHQVIGWWGTDAGNQEMELGLNSGTQIYWTGEYNEADFTTTTSFADGAWHHLVLTYAGASMTATAYLDGVPIGSHVLGGAWDTTLDATGLTVGGPQYQGYFFHGDLDEFAIYPTTLSASQVAAHYTASGRPTPGAPGAVGQVAVNPGDNAVAAAWNPPGDGIAVDSYRVTAIDPAGHSLASTIVPAATSTAVLTGLPAGDGWTVQVVGVNGLGAGSPSTSDGFTITGATGSYSAQVLADAPSVYYRLDDASGAPVAADSSGNGRDAAVNNTVTFGQEGALATDTNTAGTFGSGEVEMASGAGLPVDNANRSIEAWFKTTSTDQQVLTWWGTSAPDQQMELGINGGTQIYWTGEYNEADFTSPTSFADNSWHHLVVTYDGSNRTAVGYLDGTVLGSQVLGSDWDTTLDATGLMVGGPEYQGYFFHGQLDDVAIYPSVLSPTRVLAHYSAARLAGLAITSYTYNDAGRKASMTDPDGNVTTYGYDADGNQTTLVDAMGHTTAQTFDADDRLTAITYSDGTTPNVTYSYDAAGRRTAMDDGTGTSSYTYNTAKQLTQVTDGAGDTVGYGYDTLGRIDVITYPSGRQVSRGYDADSRLASVTDAAGHTDSFGYDGDSNLVSTTFGNGVVEATTVDDSDQTTGIDITNAAGTGLATFGYTYTPGGQLATTNDSLAPTSANTYSYTANRQLAGQNGDPTAYGYDGAGNITGLDTGNALTYDPAGRLQTDQPTAGAAATNYSYGANGDRTSETIGTATTSYVYDQANRLTIYTGPGASAGMGLSYDGDGLRASSGGDLVGFHVYTWDSASSDLPLLLSDGTNDYIYGPGDQVVEQVDQTDGTTSYLQHDQIGSVRLLTDNTGTIVGTRSYDPYGTLLAHDGDETTPFGYTGQYTDPSGLIYLRGRYYDPADAQFLTVDPMLDQTRTWYAYAGANPLQVTDPSGLMYVAPTDNGISSNPAPTTAQQDQEAVWLYEQQGPWTTEVYDPTTIGALSGAVPPCQLTGDQLIDIQNHQHEMNQVIDLLNEMSTVAENVGPTLQLLADLTGGTDFDNCMTKGSPSGCFMTILTVIPESRLAKIKDGLKALKDARKVKKAAEAAKTWADAAELDRTITTTGGSIDVLGNVTRSGSAVTVSDLAVYGSNGDLVGAIGASDIRATGAQLLEEASQSGVTQVTFSGVRVAGSSGLAGHEVTMTAYLGPKGGILWRMGS